MFRPFIKQYEKPLLFMDNFHYYNELLLLIILLVFNEQFIIMFYTFQCFVGFIYWGLFLS
jgi:hypothetical protein